jgi:sporulation protein YlmC with PRC-barrel domain
MLEDLHIGASVLGSDEKRLGKLTRVVIGRTDATVSHLVIDPGLAESGNLLAPGGWEKPRERVLPIDLVVAVTPETITLTCDEPAFLSQPLFEHKEFTDVEPEQYADKPAHWWSRYRVGELINLVSSSWGLGAAPYVPPEKITYSMSPNAAEIGSETPVWRRDPHKRLGTVRDVIVDPQTEHVVAYVMERHSGLGGELVELPITAIATIEDGEVYSALTDEQVAGLKEYRRNGK